MIFLITFEPIQAGHRSMCTPCTRCGSIFQRNHPASGLSGIHVKHDSLGTVIRIGDDITDSIGLRAGFHHSIFDPFCFPPFGFLISIFRESVFTICFRMKCNLVTLTDGFRSRRGSDLHHRWLRHSDLDILRIRANASFCHQNRVHGGLRGTHHDAVCRRSITPLKHGEITDGTNSDLIGIGIFDIRFVITS